MQLLEYKRKSVISVSNDEDRVRREFKEIADREEYLKVMRISQYANRPKLWMKMVCHYYMKNTKNQDFSQVSWENMNMAKRRR